MSRFFMADTLPAVDPGVAVPAPAPMPPVEVIRRYDRPGPRYTSYPTAVQFDSRYRELDYREAVARSNARSVQQPLSVYVHVPFCASPCFYCACTKIITRQMEMADGYLQRLELEIERQGELFPRARAIEQLHFGGGTPTFMPIDHLSCIFGSLSRHFTLSRAPTREFSIEIDPRTVTPSALFELADLGFNRISLGVQDFDPAVQAAVNREQDPDATLALIEAAPRAGIDSVSVDLIYGLPLQTVASFARTLERVIAARPQRVAAYSYAHLPQKFKPQRRIDSAQLPSGETKLALLRLTVETLLAAGYVYIGMDHFALPDDELARALADGSLQRNFQGYSTRGGLDLIGLGMSAIGRTDDTYAQNARGLSDYYAAIDGGNLAVERGLRLTREDRLRRQIIDAIMCRGHLEYASIEAAYGLHFSRYFAPEIARLQPLQDDGLVELSGQGLRVTDSGRYLLRAIAMCFDSYVAAAPQEPALAPAVPQYSRMV